MVAVGEKSPPGPSNSPSTLVIAPGRWPLLGHTPSLLRQRFAFTSALREHGDVVRIHLGTLPVYVVTSPDLVYRMLVAENAKFEKGMLFDRFRPLFGNGLAMSNGTFHLRQRRLMQPAFHRARIAGYATTMTAAATRLAKSWRPGQRIEVDKAMQGLAVTIVGETLFGTELGRSAIAEAQRSMPVVIRQGVLRALSPKILQKLPIPGNRRFDLAIDRLGRITQELIATWRAAGTDNGDLLSMLLLARDADTGEGMTDRQAHDEVITLLTGGVETTGLALSWLFHELGRNPEIERRCHAEIDEVLGGRAATMDDLPSLAYLRQVVNEVLRAYPVWLLMRRAITDVDLGGRLIPAGGELIFSPHLLHHDPRNFPDPDRFDPDRWAPERAATIPRGAYLPFGAGNRSCIGNLFAQTEITLAVAVIGARWRLRPVPGIPVRIKVTGAAYPNRLPMTAEPRPEN